MSQACKPTNHSIDRFAQDCFARLSLGLTVGTREIDGCALGTDGLAELARRVKSGIWGLVSDDDPNYGRGGLR